MVRRNPKYPLRKDEKEVLFHEHKGICHRCKLPIDPVRDPWHTGHVIDRACGGSDEWGNLAPEHKKCNLTYAAEVGNAVAAKIKRVRHKHIGAKGQSTWSKRYHAAKEWKLKREAERDP